MYVDIHTHRPTGLHIEPSAAGIHPWEAGSGDIDGVLRQLREVQAAGEIGLDFLRGPSREKQEEVLRMQLAAAERLGRPVVLHCVRAFEPMMKILGDYTLRAVIFHGFTGSPEQARRAVQRGYLLSFGLRSLRSPKTVEALRQTPVENIFAETDDDPAPIEEAYVRIAEVKELTIGELQAALLKNYDQIFDRR